MLMLILRKVGERIRMTELPKLLEAIQNHHY
jgi:hypothetical protein